MKRFKSFLTEAPTGDCFPTAGRYMLNMDDDMERAGMRMVHALVRGVDGTKMEGRRFGHAFLRLGDVIIDNSNGKNHVGRKEGYYKAGQINPKERGAYVEYDKEETLIKMARNKHWGPWDLNEKLEEDVPNEPSEIGKKRLKISASELKGIK